MRYIENLESVNKKMIIDENGLKITQDAILLSEFIKKYFNNTNYIWSFKTKSYQKSSKFKSWNRK